jgi:Peptidase M50B-like
MTAPVAAGLTPTVVAGAAVAALLLVGVAYEAVGALVTVVHEGAHTLVGILTGQKIEYFEVIVGGRGRTQPKTAGWWPARILTAAAGYLAPSLVGLGGAALLATGKVVPLLWTAGAVLVMAFLKAEKEWTTFVVLLLAAAVGYVALYGAPVLQAAFAAGLVWVLLFGGLRAAAQAGKQKDTDPDRLFRDTLVPRTLWKIGFVAFALYCLYRGTLLLVR